MLESTTCCNSPFANIDQISPNVTYFNPPPSNMFQNITYLDHPISMDHNSQPISNNFKKSPYVYMTINYDEVMNYLSDEAITYKTIIQ
ncbi:hypothetical protein Glove_74g282 [Diversispora epigaea]|uniref:Uncharacterized protein n=1 Tax=Diversispora epigaea TaxID=1348612 RepID=A0A397JCR4_9GLOM|nr:hypothetical protein Glove_74g282 [Diversispora epigaea]